MTARPSGAFCSPPSPNPRAMGTMPMIVANAVITTGRNRVASDSIAARTESPRLGVNARSVAPRRREGEGIIRNLFGDLAMSRIAGEDGAKLAPQAQCAHQSDGRR